MSEDRERQRQCSCCRTHEDWAHMTRIGPPGSGRWVCHSCEEEAALGPRPATERAIERMEDEPWEI